ncbi:MAG: hypothetical protein ACTHLX_01220 [Candidatus Binatia bacterium]|jgi:hypothetical protein
MGLAAGSFDQSTGSTGSGSTSGSTGSGSTGSGSRGTGSTTSGSTAGASVNPMKADFERKWKAAPAAKKKKLAEQIAAEVLKQLKDQEALRRFIENDILKQL